MEYIINILKGAAIGIANAIPGVSGGTIAVILKIYDRFLSCLTLNLKKLFKDIKFISALVIGILLGILAASFLLSYLFETHNVPTQLFFIGVILGSMPEIFRECTKETKLKPIHIVPFLIAFVGMILFNALSSAATNSSDSIHPIAIMLMTAVSAAAMIMPGLSGALVLKVLGGYDLAIKSVSSLDIGTLIFYAIGAVIGLLIAGKVISFLLSKWHCGTYCAIIGLILGSMPAIFPSGFAFNADGIIGIIVLIIGLIIPNIPEFVKKRKAAVGSSEDNK